MLVDKFAKCAPLIAVMHHKQMVSLRDEVVRDKRWRAVIVERTLLINGFFDDSSVRDYCHSAAANLESVETAILLGPLCEPDNDRVRLGLKFNVSPTQFPTCLMWVYAFGIWCKFPMNGSVGGPADYQSTYTGRA